MVRIPSNPLAVRERSLQDLRDEFLVRCHAKNLSERTIRVVREAQSTPPTSCPASGGAEAPHRQPAPTHSSSWTP